MISLRQANKQKYQQVQQEMVFYLSEPRCPVYPRAVDEQRMEEHRVSLLHDKVNLGTLVVVINNPVEKLVCLTLGGEKIAGLKSLG